MFVLCLAATEQGLATCWVCNFDAELCKKSFGLGDNEEAAVLIPIGYAADEPKEKKRKAIEEIVKWNGIQKDRTRKKINYLEKQDE